MLKITFIHWKNCPICDVVSSPPHWAAGGLAHSNLLQHAGNWYSALSVCRLLGVVAICFTCLWAYTYVSSCVFSNSQCEDILAKYSFILNMFAQTHPYSHSGDRVKFVPQLLVLPVCWEHSSLPWGYGLWTLASLSWLGTKLMRKFG